jgi:short-subunit dehydrogenase
MSIENQVEIGWSYCKLMIRTMSNNKYLALIAFISALYWRHHIRKTKLRKAKRQVEDIVIIGASSGIGKEMALQYADRGCDIVLVARRTNELEEVSAQCQELSPSSRILTFCGDISNEVEMSNCTSFCESSLLHCDKLVLCAGVLSLLPFEEVQPDVIDTMFKINVIGVC